MSKEDKNMQTIYGGMRDFQECPKCGCPWFKVSKVVALNKFTKDRIRKKTTYRCENCDEILFTEDKNLAQW